MTMDIKSAEHRHFHSYSTLLVDIGGDALRNVVEKFCQEKNITFHDFLSEYKENLFYARTAVKNPSTLRPGTAFNDFQWKQLFMETNNHENRLSNTQTANLQNDCPEIWNVDTSVKLENLEIKFVRDIVYNVRPILSFYLGAYMRKYGQSDFQSFLNGKRHVLYHHFRKQNCCLCSSATNYHQSERIHLTPNQWRFMFDGTGNSRKCSSSDSCCSCVFRPRKISESDLHLSVFGKVLTITVPLFQFISSVISKRHSLYAHPMNGTRMEAASFNKEWEYLKKCILGIIENIEGTDTLDIWKQNIDLLRRTLEYENDNESLSVRMDRMECKSEIRYKAIDQVQRQILKEVTGERKINIDLTRDRINDHMRSPRTMTDSVEKGLEHLENRHALLFTGSTGQGKTWHCLEILSRLDCKNIVEIDGSNLDLREWERLVGREDEIVIWIDNLTTSAIRNQNTFFERLKVQLSKCNGKMQFLSSISSSELQKLACTNAKHWLLKESSIIDLNSEDSQHVHVHQQDNSENQFSEPVHIKECDLLGDRASTENPYPSHPEVYKAVSRTVGQNDISGLERTKGLWRISFRSNLARSRFLQSDFYFNEKKVTIYDTIPDARHDAEDSKQNVMARIKNVPLSTDDTHIKRVLKSHGCVIVSLFKEKLIVDERVTHCYTGDRLGIIVQLEVPLPIHVDIGGNKATVFRTGQKDIDICNKCFQTGHSSRICTNKNL